MFRDSPLVGAGVDVLAVSGVLHQRHVVVGGQGEVGHAAHQASNVLPVRVEGDLLHATFSETREEIVRKWLVLSSGPLGSGWKTHTHRHIRVRSCWVVSSFLATSRFSPRSRPLSASPTDRPCRGRRPSTPQSNRAGELVGRMSTLQSYCNVPHSFDSVPLAVSKGPVDSDVSRAAAKVIAGSMRKQTQCAQSVEQAAPSSQALNATSANKSQDISSRTDIISCQL